MNRSIVESILILNFNCAQIGVMEWVFFYSGIIEIRFEGKARRFVMLYSFFLFFVFENSMYNLGSIQCISSFLHLVVIYIIVWGNEVSAFICITKNCNVNVRFISLLPIPRRDGILGIHSVLFCSVAKFKFQLVAHVSFALLSDTFLCAFVGDKAEEEMKIWRELLCFD